MIHNQRRKYDTGNAYRGGAKNLENAIINHHGVNYHDSAIGISFDEMKHLLTRQNQSPAPVASGDCRGSVDEAIAFAQARHAALLRDCISFAPDTEIAPDRERVAEDFIAAIVKSAFSVTPKPVEAQGVDDCRAAFEKWCASVHEPEHLMELDENGQYRNHVMFCQWQAYKAGIRHATTRTPAPAMGKDEYNWTEMYWEPGKGIVREKLKTNPLLLIRRWWH